MKLRVVTLGILLSLPAHAADIHPESGPKRLWKWSIAALAAANTADAASSFGRYELNPVLGVGRFCPRATGIKFGISSAAIGAQYLMLRRRPEAARKAAWVNFTLAGATAGIAVRNLSQ
jgi:hypothetical protein